MNFLWLSLEISHWILLGFLHWIFTDNFVQFTIHSFSVTCQYAMINLANIFANTSTGEVNFFFREDEKITSIVWYGICVETERRNGHFLTRWRTVPEWIVSEYGAGTILYVGYILAAGWLAGWRTEWLSVVKVVIWLCGQVRLVVRLREVYKAYSFTHQHYCRGTFRIDYWSEEYWQMEFYMFSSINWLTYRQWLSEAIMQFPIIYYRTFNYFA